MQCALSKAIIALYNPVSNGVAARTASSDTPGPETQRPIQGRTHRMLSQGRKGASKYHACCISQGTQVGPPSCTCAWNMLTSKRKTCHCRLTPVVGIFCLAVRAGFCLSDRRLRGHHRQQPCYILRRETHCLDQTTLRWTRLCSARPNLKGHPLCWPKNDFLPKI